MKKNFESLYETLGGTYREGNGHLIPNVTLLEQTEYQIGKYGRMHLDYIKQHRRGRYTTLLTEGKLNARLHEIYLEANEMLETTIEKGTLALTESGVYEVSIIAGGKTQKFTVTVDATAPTLTLNGVENGGATTDAVTLTDVSEEAEVVVTLNGEQIEYTVGDELTEIGEYKVTVTDAYGNATEYDFTIEKGANIALIVILIILGVAAIGTGVFFYFKKKNSI